MRNKKVVVVACSAALIGVVGIGATLAYFTDRDNTENVITMGHVDISLDEPVFSEEHPDNTISNVTPGQVIAKDPTITVETGSEDSYLRVKLDVTGSLAESYENDILAALNIDYNNWALSEEDGYLYYQNRVSAGDEIQVFNKVTIPYDWSNDLADVTFNIDIEAEAIQADNFTPSIDETSGKIIGWEDPTGQAITAETYTE